MTSNGTPRYRRAANLNVGDQVTARHHLGGFIRRPVRRGTPGIITAIEPAGILLHVTFTTGHTLTLEPTDVIPAHPGFSSW